MQALDEARSIYREIGNRSAEGEALNEAGTLHRVQGDTSRARLYHQQALDLARATGIAWDEAQSLAGLGRCALAGGDTGRAGTLLREALAIFQRDRRGGGRRAVRRTECPDQVLDLSRGVKPDGAAADELPERGHHRARRHHSRRQPSPGRRQRSPAALRRGRNRRYDAATSAEDLHQLVAGLGLGPVHLLCQDISGGVGFRFAATHPADIRSFIAIETTLAGFGLEALADVNHGGSWHVGFLAAPGIPGLLLAGHERELLAGWAYPLMTAVEGSVTDGDIDEFTRT